MALSITRKQPLKSLQPPSDFAKHRSKCQHRCSGRRRGAIGIAVLACMVVVTTIAFSSMAISIRHRRHMRDDLRIEQTRWILDGSVRMAISKVRQNPEYMGETVIVDTALSVFDTATVIIKATPDSQTGKVQLEVAAELTRAHQDQEQATNGLTKKYRRSTSVLISLDK